MKFENIHVGDWITIIDCNHEVKPNMWGIVPDKVYDGAPARVEAVSYPFVCVQWYHGKTQALDIRTTTLTKVNDQYAQAFINACEGHPDQQERTPMVAQRPRRRRRERQPAGMEVIDPSQCRRCGNQCNQRMNYHARQWEFVCATCGHNQGPVPN